MMQEMSRESAYGESKRRTVAGDDALVSDFVCAGPGADLVVFNLMFGAPLSAANSLQTEMHHDGW